MRRKTCGSLQLPWAVIAAVAGLVGLLILARTAVKGPFSLLQPVLATGVEPEVAPLPGPPVLTWVGERDGVCMEATFSSARALVGPCGGPATSTELRDDFVTRNLPVFVGAFGPFEAETPAGRVTFDGRGERPPMPVEQRAVAEFARAAATLLSTGHHSPYGTVVLQVRTRNDPLRFCEDMTLFVTGEVWVVACGGDAPVPLATGRLNPSQLTQLYHWVDTLQPFHFETHPDAGPDERDLEVTFVGRGDTPVSDADHDEMRDFVIEIRRALVSGKGVSYF